MLTANTAYYVAVPAYIFDAAVNALGDRFDGTINQLDTWVKENMEPSQFIEYLEAPVKASKSKRYASRCLWTAYLA